MQTRTALIFTQDRAASATLSAVSTGIGTSNTRDASSRMAAREQAKLWPDTQPVPISTLSTRTQFTMARKATSDPKGNPFSGRMMDTLSKPRAVREGGNRTANQTVLGAVDRRRSGGYHLSAGNPAKRQKVEQEHDVTSRFWRLDAGASTISGNGKDQGKNKDKGKGKGKAPAQSRSGSAQTEPIQITDSDDDIGAPLPQPQKPEKKGAERESTPDPLDLIGSRGSPESVKDPHDFDRPPNARLPQDGEATRRLRLRTFAEHERSKEPDIVTVDESSEIESASGFDREDEVRQAATPNGRPQIPRGLVKEKIHAYEKKDSGNSVQPQPQSRPPVIRTIDFKLQQPGRGNVKASMKGRDGGSKPAAPNAASLSMFNRVPASSAAKLDPFTTPSSFTSSPATPAPAARKKQPTSQKPEHLVALPLSGVSFGCQLETNDADSANPLYWARIEHHKPRNRKVLKIVDKPGSSDFVTEFPLDGAFDHFTWTEITTPSKQSSVVIQFQSTSLSAGPVRKGFYEPGVQQATGKVSLRFFTDHANFNAGLDGDTPYDRFVKLLRENIVKSSSLRGEAAAARCWETVQRAAEHGGAAVERNSSGARQTKGAVAGPSSISAGPSTSASATIESPANDVLVSAPSTRRAYATERRVTRQTARSTRPSPTPEALEELVLVYPPSGTGAVNITRGDLKRLDNGQYLNDTLIEFGLKVWLDDLRTEQPDLAEKVHIFNSFFFKKLNSKKEVKDSYASVRKWTSKVDIFSKKYIIVPINENFHWYLAIIVNPDYMLHPPPPETRIAPHTRKRKRDEQLPADAPDATKNAEGVETAGTAGAVEVADTADGSTEDGSGENRSETAPSESNPDGMAVDQESEGDHDGQEVETMLRFSQSCNIAEPGGAGRGAELLYPSSEDAMDVDPVSGPDKESKPPDAAGDEGAGLDRVNEDETSSVDKPRPVEEVVAAAALAGGPPAVTKENAVMSVNDTGEPNAPAGQTSLAKLPDAHIYTFDSLGSRHPRTVSKLAQYLQHEAVDKKKFQIEDTCIAQYKLAKAPMQKNFCDCGLFVLAFVKAFMADPARSIERIHANKPDWYTGHKENLRETFRERTIALSEAWKKERAGKEGSKEESPSENAKAKAKAPEAEVIEDSDDDIIVGEVIPPPAQTKGGNRGGKKGATKAARLRG